MATIFRAKGDREVVTWTARSAVIYTRDTNVTEFTGSEQFDIEASGGGPVTIGPFNGIPDWGGGGFPWTDDQDFKTDIQGELDDKLGAGAVTMGTLATSNENDWNFFFADSAAGAPFNTGFIEISNVSQENFETFQLPNIRRDTTQTNTSINPQVGSPGNASLGFFPPFNLKPDLSSLYEIPEGANEITLWTTLQGNDEETDGYGVGFAYQVAWTNGVDGYAEQDGYFHDLMLSTNENPVAPDLSGGSAQAANFSPKWIINYLHSGVSGNFGGTSGERPENPISTKNAVIIPVPPGATGVYVVSGVYLRDDGEDTPPTATPPTFTCAITAGTR